VHLVGFTIEITCVISHPGWSPDCFLVYVPIVFWMKQLSLTLQFWLVHLILDKNLNTQSLLQHITSKNTSNVFT
jgi:hypothetical protein